MQIAEPRGVGWIIALGVLIFSLFFLVLAKMFGLLPMNETETVLAFFIVLLAVARLIA